MSKRSPHSEGKLRDRAIHLPKLRRCVSIACGLFFLLGAVYLFFDAIYLLAGVFLLLGGTLVVNKVWTHQCAAYLFVFVSIIIPLGAVNPFHTSEFIAAQYVHTPSVPQILAWLIPLEMSLLCFVWLIEQPRSSNVEDYND
ncbi:MAG: hypothetical protein Q3M24_12355 [Candidatus Electrothrix aestuarii]|uniref:Lycopene cyclase domain-containing protein n=1 Tax=Candidatus Electrothrix aestuarii TaxID=3062594 RepID=A0AAU8LQJ8_9BACT|nr:hypothetical protein [Candidatus Electrothrix aestuarii]